MADDDSETSSNKRFEPYYGLVVDKVERGKELVSKAYTRYPVDVKLKRLYSEYSFRLKKAWSNKWRQRFNWIAFDLTPFVGAYGFGLNLLTSNFDKVVSGEFTVQTVATLGVLYYFAKVEAPEIWNKISPLIEVKARVDN